MKYIILIIFGGMLLLQSCRNAPIQLFTVKEVQTSKDVTLLDIDQKQLSNLRIDNAENVEIVVPFGGKIVTLELKQQELFTPDFKIMTDRGQTTFNPGLYYEGKIKGNDESLVSISIDDKVNGFISTDEGNTNISPTGEDYAMFAQTTEQPFTCGTSEIAIEEKYRQRIVDEVQAQAGNCVTIDFELTYECFQTFGSVSATSNWFIQLFSGVKTVFTQEGINASIKNLYIWTSDDGYSSSPSQALNELQSRRLNDPNFTGNIVHLIRVQSSNLSGIAYLNGLCSPYNKSFSQLPAQISNNQDYSWGVMVILHETAHTIAINHTHWCGWVKADGTTGALDGCAAVEGTCVRPALGSAGSGTIESYCHQNIGISFKNGFGPIPRAKLLTTIATRPCTNCTTTPPPPTPTCTDLVKNGQETGIDCGGPICPPCSIVPPPTTPISQGKTATLFPNYSTLYPASKGNDGIESNFFSTHADPSPWWTVDLGSNTGVTRIQIINRKDCCGDRLKNFKVYVSVDNAFSANEVVYTHSTVCTNGQAIEIPLTGKSGRYVKVEAQNSPANYLHLSEVRVYNTPVAGEYFRDSIGKTTHDTAYRVKCIPPSTPCQ